MLEDNRAHQHKANLSTLNDVDKQNKVRYKMNKKSSPEKVNFLMQKAVIAKQGSGILAHADEIRS